MNTTLLPPDAVARRIDRETRELLQSTFDTVNGHFGRLFPELFGGGRAEGAPETGASRAGRDRGADPHRPAAEPDANTR